MINTSDIMSGTADIYRINIAKDEYISLGHLPRHISNPETIHDDFLSKCTEMKSEMFEKEYEQFIEFCRSLAMETGSCFKADKLAKLLGITRRKVNKYMEILLKYGVVKAIGPWVQDAETETSRHVKIYFSDLSFYRPLLSDMYYQ
jgi:predicted AAA+ superfamily ATPase